MNDNEQRLLVFDIVHVYSVLDRKEFNLRLSKGIGRISMESLVVIVVQNFMN